MFVGCLLASFAGTAPSRAAELERVLEYGRLSLLLTDEP